MIMDVITTHLEERKQCSGADLPTSRVKDRIISRTPAPKVYRFSDVSNAYDSAIGSKSRSGGKDSAHRK